MPDELAGEIQRKVERRLGSERYSINPLVEYDTVGISEMILPGIWEEPIFADLWKLTQQGFDKFLKNLDLESGILPRDNHGKSWRSVQNGGHAGWKCGS